MNTKCLEETRRGIRESIHKAVLEVWDSRGFSITALGKLERIELYAYADSYDYWFEGRRA